MSSSLLLQMSMLKSAGQLHGMLDHHDFNDRKQVNDDVQVALAVELRKPLFMHCRDAAQKFAEILR
jgi:Tat protein secretion system quality control protein TatD with DNase activity